MTIFTPYKNNPADPSYLGFSKEPDRISGDASAATAITGLGNVFDVGIKAVDEVNKIDIKNTATRAVDTELRDSVSAGLGLIAGEASATGETTSLDITPQNIPPGVTRGIRQANMLTQANKLGKMDDVNFEGNLQTLSQHLVERYPGYTKEIHEAISSARSVNPMNKQREAIKQTLTQLSTGKQAEQNKWLTEMHGDQKYFIGPDGRFDSERFGQAMSAFGNPQAMLAIRTFIAERKANEHSDTIANNRITRLKNEGALNEDRAVTEYHQIGTRVLSDTMANFRAKVGDETMSWSDLNGVINQALQSGGQTKQQLLQQLGPVVAQFSNHYEAEMRKRGLELAPYIRDKAKIDGVINTYKDMFNVAVQHVTEGNTRLGTNQMNTIEGMTNNIAMQQLSVPIFQQWAGQNKAIGGQANAALINHWLTSQGPGGAATSLRDLNALTLRQMEILSADQNGLGSLKTSLDRFRQFNPSAPGSTSGAPQQLINTPEAVAHLQAEWAGLKNLILHPNATPDSRLRAARVIAHGNSTELIQEFKPEEQMTVWANISTPQVAATLKKELPPQEWQRYVTWNQETFRRLYGTQMDTITQNARDVPSATWNETEGRIDYPKVPINPRAANREGNQRLLPRQVKQAIDQINIGLTSYKALLEANGQKLTEGHLRNIGIDLGVKQPPEGSDELPSLFHNLDRQGRPSGNVLPFAETVDIDTRNRITEAFQVIREARENEHLLDPMLGEVPERLRGSEPSGARKKSKNPQWLR